MSAQIFVHPTLLQAERTLLELERETQRVTIVQGKRLQLITHAEYFRPVQLPPAGQVGRRP